jgi:hypothetical protein
MYGRRLQDTLDRSRSAVRRVQQAQDNIVEYKRKSCLARCTLARVCVELRPRNGLSLLLSGF